MSKNETLNTLRNFFSRFDNKCKQSHCWIFSYCPLTLRSSPLRLYGATNRSRAFDSLWLDKFIDRNFSKVMDSNQIFSNDFVCILYHLCKTSVQIFECIIFAPSLWTLTTFYSMVINTMVTWACARLGYLQQ